MNIHDATLFSFKATSNFRTAAAAMDSTNDVKSLPNKSVDAAVSVNMPTKAAAKTVASKQVTTELCYDCLQVHESDYHISKPTVDHFPDGRGIGRRGTAH